MTKKSSKRRIKWNPTTVAMVYQTISKKEEQLLLTSVAQLIYDLACQFSEEDKKASCTNPNFSGHNKRGSR